MQTIGNEVTHDSLPSFSIENESDGCFRLERISLSGMTSEQMCSLLLTNMEDSVSATFHVQNTSNCSPLSNKLAVDDLAVQSTNNLGLQVVFEQPMKMRLPSVSVVETNDVLYVKVILSPNRSLPKSHRKLVARQKAVALAQGGILRYLQVPSTHSLSVCGFELVSWFEDEGCSMFVFRIPRKACVLEGGEEVMNENKEIP